MSNANQSRTGRLRQRWISGLTFLWLSLSLGLAACGEASPIPAPITILPPAVTQALTTAAATTSATKTTPATSAPTTLTPASSKGTLVQIFPALSDLAATTTTLSIQDDWSGMGFGYSHRTAHYNLERQPNGEFNGTVVFQLGTYPVPSEAVRAVKIPTAVAHTFLQSLLAIPMQEGQPKPQNTSTDDYPDYTLYLKVGSNPLVIHSTSQEQNRVPWTVSFAGHQYFVDSDEPTRALANLSLYMAQDVLSQLEKDILKTPEPTYPPTSNRNAAPTPTPVLQPSTLSQKYALLAHPGHTERVTAVQFSPDGKMFASGGDDPFIKVWEVATNKEVATLQGHFPNTAGLAFSPDGKNLASAHSNGLLTLWNVSGTPIVISEKVAQQTAYPTAFALAFAPDGKSIVTAHRDSATKLWEVRV